ncbi:hypothetical protein BDR26DRAFT_18498 [Obelidium mucronatum]|nr:hypothetical protein BDR26DRAFT_18498 [Obelidium mucronatum]
MLSSCDSVGLLSPASAARINMGSFGRIVVIRRTGEDGSAFPVNQEVVSFGRDQTCTIRVRFEEVSRFHCTITVDAATRKASLHDKSSNGTILNWTRRGSKLTKSALF